jgi:hypothetical protein
MRRIEVCVPLVHLINPSPATARHASCPAAGALTRPVRPSYFLNGAIIVQQWSHASFRIGHALTVASFA